MEKRFFAVVVLVGGSAVLAGQVRAQVAAPEPVAHEISGTKVWLVPPPGFGPTAGLSGVRRGAAALQVMEMPGSNYYQQAAGFSPARFTARGGQVLEFRPLVAGEYAGQLARVRLNPTQESAQLLFGDSTFVVLLDARYPAADTATGAALRRSLLSATYRPTNATSPAELGNTVFVLDGSKSPFALALAGHNRYTYAVGGQRKADYGLEPLLTVSTYPYNPSITAADIGAQVLSRETGLNGYHVRKTTSGKINELVTYETEGLAQLRGRAVLVYQQVTVVGSTAVAMQGIAHADFEQALSQFKALTHTIKAR